MRQHEKRGGGEEGANLPCACVRIAISGKCGRWGRVTASFFPMSCLLYVFLAGWMHHKCKDLPREPGLACCLGSGCHYWCEERVCDMRTRDGMRGGARAWRGGPWRLGGCCRSWRGGLLAGDGGRSWSGCWVAPRRRFVIHVWAEGKPCGYSETRDAGEADVKTGVYVGGRTWRGGSETLTLLQPLTGS